MAQRTSTAPQDRDELIQAARRLFAGRRALDRRFSPGLIHDPVLDILLALFTTDADAVPVARIAQDAGINPAVARRWIVVLQDEGIVTAEGARDSADAEAALTEKGEATLGDAIAAAVAALAE